MHEAEKAEAEKFLAKLGGGVLAVAIGAVLIPLFFFPLAILDAWVISRLYRWFVVPLFEVEPVPVVYCVGLLLLIRHVTVMRLPKDDRKLSEIYLGAIISPLVVLGLGWIVSRFIR
jgi:hypothetical protein